ncbi:extracellular solute-binding protein [Agarivorans sp. B2Z047]|uniref:ABC transporter substrate-binding protein n=1 Tax=Agarivorans sp. B2Z047 TaxID=2652721 RepID=UPI00128CAFE7|nr:extracellular solute-binding protein [Agarivorans sp. B2Z047]MPW31735.1 extracellular solute-binding protein [Agarivorans sp. B2Z047]UQN44798.1 extracellular solute-binding protein [Agarivorans sp. B2Z047]
MELKKLSLALVIAGTAVAAQAETTIRYDCWPNHDKTAVEKIDDFYKANPGIKVEVLSNNWVDHHNKLTTALATGDGAGDVVCIDVEKIGAIVNQGGFANMSKAFNAVQDENKFAPFAWVQGKGADGEQYALPLNVGPGVMYYRREHMQDKGFNPEAVTKDWDALMAWGEELKAKGVPLVGHAGSIAQAIINTEVEAGNSIYFDKDDNPIVTNERFVKAFTYAKMAREKGLDARIGDWSSEWFEGLKNANFAIQFSGAWLAGFLESWIAPDTGGKWGVSGLPAGNYGSWGGTFLAIPEQSKNKEEAYKLVEYLTKNRDIVLYEFKTNAAFPALKSSYDAPMFQEEMPFLGGQKARLLWTEIAENIKPIKPSKADNIARAIILEQALPAVVEEGKDVKEALADAEKQIKRRMRSL